MEWSEYVKHDLLIFNVKLYKQFKKFYKQMNNSIIIFLTVGEPF